VHAAEVEADLRVSEVVDHVTVEHDVVVHTEGQGLGAGIGDSGWHIWVGFLEVLDVFLTDVGGIDCGAPRLAFEKVRAAIGAEADFQHMFASKADACVAEEAEEGHIRNGSAVHEVAGRPIFD
jgi:hypothetical protein